ncbi:MAG: hypothetical protein DLM61_25575 [Pseudonocardiales bacterium]|nr:MAG: hypothetical protein DLM61_25575 [Pseudonocardiales bacterium]
MRGAVMRWCAEGVVWLAAPVTPCLERVLSRCGDIGGRRVMTTVPFPTIGMAREGEAVTIAAPKSAPEI